jgi:hypothetical protein
MVGLLPQFLRLAKELIIFFSNKFMKCAVSRKLEDPHALPEIDGSHWRGTGEHEENWPEKKQDIPPLAKWIRFVGRGWGHLSAQQLLDWIYLDGSDHWRVNSPPTPSFMVVEIYTTFILKIT